MRADYVWTGKVLQTGDPTDLVEPFYLVFTGTIDAGEDVGVRWDMAPAAGNQWGSYANADAATDAAAREITHGTAHAAAVVASNKTPTLDIVEATARGKPDLSVVKLFVVPELAVPSPLVHSLPGAARITTTANRMFTVWATLHRIPTGDSNGPT